MANELVQGLFQSLLAPQQTQQNDPTAIMAAINSSNPMAAAMAYNLGSTGQVTKGLLGQISGGRLSTATPQEYMQQAVTASPELLQTSAGMQQLAQMAQQAGDRPTALRLSLMSQEKAVEEAQLAKEQAREGQQTMNITNLQNSVSQLAVRKGRPEIADAVKGMDSAADIMKLAEPLYKTEEAALTPYQQATLSRNYTPESVAAYAKNPSTTVLVPKEGSPQPGAYAIRAADAGFGAPGTPENQAQVRKMMERDEASARRTASPLEETRFLDDQLISNPTFQKAEEALSTIGTLRDLMPVVGSSTNPQSVALLTTALPNLIANDVRAVAELEHFRTSKGIKESIGDWAIQAMGGTVTAETRENYRELLDILETSYNVQRFQEMDKVSNLFGSFVGDDVLDSWRSAREESADLETIADRYLGR